MSASKLNLPILEKGATWRHSLIWKDAAGQPINLTGCSAKLQVRETLSAEAVLLELSTENNRISITPSLGRFDLVIAANDTALLIGCGGCYDLEVTFSNSDVTRLIEGNWVFKGEVTR